MEDVVVVRVLQVSVVILQARHLIDFHFLCEKLQNFKYPNPPSLHLAQTQNNNSGGASRVGDRYMGFHYYATYCWLVY